MILQPPTSPLFPYTTLFRSTEPRMILILTQLEDDPPVLRLDERLRDLGADPVVIGPATLEQPSALVVENDPRSEEHTSELQSRQYLVCRLLLEKKNISCKPS